MNDRFDELRNQFSPHEVETTEELLRCLSGPPTADGFRRMLLLFLRGHYSSADNYMGFDDLNCYTWHPDEQQRKLEVEFTHNEEDRKPDSYPGVFVGFAETNFEKLGIGNYAGNTQDNAGTHHAKEAVANYEVHHVAKRSTDAHLLAELTSRVLLAMGPVMASSGGATGFEVMGFRTPRRKKPGVPLHYTVATPVQIKYTVAVTRTLESHRIRMISQRIAAETSTN